MKILHLYRAAFPESMGGIEQFIHQLATGTTRRGVSNEVLTLSRERAATSVAIGGYRVHRSHLDCEFASTGFSLSVLPHFARLAQEADLIHYHFPWPFMDLVHFASRVQRPTVVTYHSDIIRQQFLLKLYRPLKRRFLASVDRIVATSPNYLNSSLVLENHRDKVSVIPIGLDRASYPEPAPARLDFWRDRLGPKFFLFVGVMRYYKGLHILLEAARDTRFPVAIVGAGPIEAELKAYATRLGLNNVHFLGYLDDEDKVALLKLSHALVFPSHLRSEAFGISLLEGAMYGKPLISSEIGTGTTFINIAGETGMVIPPGDPGALARAMEQLWHDPALAAAMGRRAEQRYRALFTAERMVDAYMDLYASLCA